MLRRLGEKLEFALWWRKAMPASTRRERLCNFILALRVG